jgi:taurine dioxygenase
MITFTPVAGHLGADVHGIDLSQPLDADQVAAINEGLLEHLVLFFRKQNLLSFDQHKALASNFGEMETTTYRRQDRDEKVQLIEGGVEGLEAPTGLPTFHADSSFRDNRPLGALLQAHILPERGGDTEFASMYAAYEALSPAMRGFLDGLDCYHSLMHMHRRHIGNPKHNLRLNVEENPPLKTPVVRVHPETGRKFLNVNLIYTSHIDGLREDESELLLRFLYDHIRRPEFAVRLKWNVGDVAFWDNWSVQHCGIPDYTGHRLLHRISIVRPSRVPALDQAA